jgi:hypothetical protein
VSEWAGWSEASKRASAVCTNYIVGKEDKSFDPLHRRAEIYSNLEQTGFRVEGGVENLPRPNPKATIQAAANEIFQYFVDGYKVLIGVPNKGYAILLEIAEHLNLPKSSVHNLDDLKPLELAGKKAVLFDDTIHLGRSLPKVAAKLREQNLNQCIAVVLWASEDGLAEVEAQVSDVFSSIEVRRISEELFGLIFQIEVSPMIYCLRAGAVAHRPSTTFNLVHGELDKNAMAAAILTNLANSEGPTHLFEPPPQDGFPSETFHGTLEFWSGPIIEDLEEELGSRADSIEYAKVRAFIFPTEAGFRVHLAAIVSAEGIDADLDAGELDEELSGRLLQKVAGSFEQLVKAGQFTIV